MENQEISPFIRLKVESEDWTGYKPEIVDAVYNRGRELEEENRELRNKASYQRRNAMETFWRGFGEFIGGAIVVGVVVIVVIFIFVGMTGEERRGQAFRYGYYVGQTRAISDNIDFELREGELGRVDWYVIKGEEPPLYPGSRDSKGFNYRYE